MDMSDGKVVFKWASDEITNNASTYVTTWALAQDAVASNATSG